MGNSVENTFVVCGCADAGNAFRYNRITGVVGATEYGSKFWGWCLVRATCVAYHRNLSE